MDQIKATLKVDIKYLLKNKDYCSIYIVNESLFKIDKKLEKEAFDIFIKEKETANTILTVAIPYISTVCSNLILSAGMHPFVINYNDFIIK